MNRPDWYTSGEADISRGGVTRHWLAIVLCLALLFASMFTLTNPTARSYAPQSWSNASIMALGEYHMNSARVAHRCCADGAGCAFAATPGDVAGTTVLTGQKLVWPPQLLPSDQAISPLLQPPKLFTLT